MNKKTNLKLQTHRKVQQDKMSTSDPAILTLILLDTAAVLFLLIYFVITISDLECDYINAQQCCSRLNMWMKPKMYAHLFAVALLLIKGYWLLVLANLPMVCWLLYELANIPGGNVGVYEPTEIYNHGQLQKHMRGCMIHLGFYLIFFFLYLYCMIIALLKENPIIREDDLETEF